MQWINLKRVMHVCNVIWNLYIIAMTTTIDAQLSLYRRVLPCPALPCTALPCPALPCEKSPRMKFYFGQPFFNSNLLLFYWDGRVYITLNIICLCWLHNAGSYTLPCHVISKSTVIKLPAASLAPLMNINHYHHIDIFLISNFPPNISELSPELFKTGTPSL